MKIYRNVKNMLKKYIFSIIFNFRKTLIYQAIPFKYFLCIVVANLVIRLKISILEIYYILLKMF